MYIYIDILFLNNFIINLFLILLTAYVTKKRVHIFKVISGALAGNLSILLLFFKMGSFSEFILKFIIAVIMIVISFKTSLKGYLKALTIFYLLSFCLGGIIYYFNSVSGEENTVNYLTITLSALCIISLVTLAVNTVKQRLSEKKLYRNVVVCCNNKKISLTGYIDTGNTLKEPLSGLPVIIAKESCLKKLGKINTFPIMCHTLSGNGIINVFKPQKLIIDEKEEQAFIGISTNMNNDNFSVLLNNNMRRYNNAS